MRPRVRSYGESSTVTLSPGRIRIKCMRIFPEMCARILWPLSNDTRNIAFGNVSFTVPCISITSSFGTYLYPFYPHPVIADSKYAEVHSAESQSYVQNVLRDSRLPSPLSSDPQEP